MKKRITQWFIGLFLGLYGSLIYVVGGFCIYVFIRMINTTGRECIGYFVEFVFYLLVFIFLPYIFFHHTKDGIQDRWK